MLNDSKKILNENQFLNDRKNAKLIHSYNRAKRIYLLLSVLFCLAVIATIYLLLDVSNIYRISVDGNIYLKDEDIIVLSGLSTNNKYIFTNTKNVESKILANPIVSSCKVELSENRLVKIEVNEKKIIGYGQQEGKNLLFMADGSSIELNKENLYLIGYVPLIEGFTTDDIILIGKQLSDVDYKMINQISEMHYYPDLKFQNHEIIMRDGNYIFTSVYGLNLLNKYYSMVSSFENNKQRCYYVEDISGNAYTSACPWTPQEETQEVKTEEAKEE